LLELLVAAPVPPEARGPLVDLAAGRGGGPGDRERRIRDVVVALSTLPEFHLA
jgi:hypothetical protein